MDKKLAQKIAHHKWYLKNKDKVIKDKQEWRKNNPKKYRAQSERANKKISIEQKKQYNKIARKKLKDTKPFYFHYKNAKERCNNPNKDNYKNYGGRGIKFLMTVKDFKELWFRDRAYLMEKPSIDRKESNGNYEYNNCRFMELSDNIKRRFNNE